MIILHEIVPHSCCGAYLKPIKLQKFLFSRDYIPIKINYEYYKLFLQIDPPGHWVLKSKYSESYSYFQSSQSIFSIVILALIMNADGPD